MKSIRLFDTTWMKSRYLRAALSLIMAAAVLFSTVGISYLHDRHDAHEYISKAEKNKTSFHKHGEHCKVCSFDLCINLYVADHDPLVSPPFGDIASSPAISRFVSLPAVHIKGRAPPSIV